MDDLINEIQERTGLSTEKVLEVVTIVTEYMREALPDDLVEQVSFYLGGAAGIAGTTASSVTETAVSGATGVVEAASGIAGAAYGAAMGAVKDLSTPGDDG